MAGACEAPPAIVSTYLGDDMTEYLTAYAKGGGKYEPKTKDLSMGVEGMRHMEIPAQDRNRTSPFPYGGHRFECVGEVRRRSAKFFEVRRSSAKTS